MTNEYHPVAASINQAGYMFIVAILSGTALGALYVYESSRPPEVRVAEEMRKSIEAVEDTKQNAVNQKETSFRNTVDEYEQTARTMRADRTAMCASHPYVLVVTDAKDNSVRSVAGCAARMLAKDSGVE